MEGIYETIHKTQGATSGFKSELAKQLTELMPEVVADGKIDLVKLGDLLSKDVADESERFGAFLARETPRPSNSLKSIQPRNISML